MANAYYDPSGSNTTRNINTGLLNYAANASNNLSFDGREVDSSKFNSNISSDTPDFATSDNYLTDGAFVENRVTGLLENPDSLLMQRAKANGLADANSRGLANTSMGATIGQSVMADKALEIATPDAATQATADVNRQTATYSSQQAQQDAQNQGLLATQAAKINSALQGQQAGNEWDSQQQKAAIQGDLNTQEAKIDSAKATQDAQYAYDATKQQGKIQGALNTQEANIDTAARTQEAGIETNLEKLRQQGNVTLQNLQNAFTEKITKMGYSQEDGQLLAGMVNSQTQNMMNQLGNLMQNEDIELTTAVTKWFTDFMYASWDSGATAMGLNIDVR